MLIEISNTGFQILHNGAISNNHLTFPLCTLLHIRPPHFPPSPFQTTPSLVQVLAWSHDPYPATALSIFAPHYPRPSKKTFCLLSGVEWNSDVLSMYTGHVQTIWSISSSILYLSFHICIICLAHQWTTHTASRYPKSSRGTCVRTSPTLIVIDIDLPCLATLEQDWFY